MPKARDHVQSVQRFFQVMRWHQAKRDAARMFRSKLMENSGALLLVPLELSPVISSIGLAPLSELLAEPAFGLVDTQLHDFSQQISEVVSVLVRRYLCFSPAMMSGVLYWSIFAHLICRIAHSPKDSVHVFQE